MSRCTFALQIKERLQEGYKVDVDPPLSDSARYMREDMSLQGYRHLLAVGARHTSHILQFFAPFATMLCVLMRCSSAVLSFGSCSCPASEGCAAGQQRVCYSSGNMILECESGPLVYVSRKISVCLQRLWMAWLRRAGRAACVLAPPTTSPA
jgi:hypothetical protein